MAGVAVGGSGLTGGEMEHAQTASRYGTLLFFLAAVFLLAAAGLNSAMDSAVDKLDRLTTRYSEAETMLGKARSARLKGENFYSAVSLQILIQEWWRKTDEKLPTDYGDSFADRPVSLPGFSQMKLTVNPVSGDYWTRFYRQNDLYRVPLFRQLEKGAESFGKEAKRIDSLPEAPEQKARLLDIALVQSFPSKTAREILADDFMDILVEKKNVDRNIRCWIALDDWPCRSGGTATGVGVSYLRRDERFLWVQDSRDHIFNSLGIAKNQDEAEALLKEEWIRAHDALLEFKIPMTQVSLPGSGLTLSVGDVLLLAGPLLIYFQILFLVSKERMAVSGSEKEAFVFPQFSAPDDPLVSLKGTRLAGFSERIIWLLFLVAPIAVLTIAVVTRYDFMSLSAYSGLPWIKKIEYSRSSDGFSALLDLINLGFLGIALVVAIRLTTLHRSASRYISDRNYRSLTVLLLNLFTVTFLAAGWSLLGREIPVWGTYFLAFAVLWLAGFLVALVRGAWTMALLSAGGFALGLSILIG